MGSIAGVKKVPGIKKTNPRTPQ
jgi:hypothetical protein